MNQFRLLPDNEGALPLGGQLPDMTSSSDGFIQLQRVRTVRYRMVDNNRLDMIVTQE